MHAGADREVLPVIGADYAPLPRGMGWVLIIVWLAIGVACWFGWREDE